MDYIIKNRILLSVRKDHDLICFLLLCLHSVPSSGLSVQEAQG